MNRGFYHKNKIHVNISLKANKQDNVDTKFPKHLP